MPVNIYPESALFESVRQAQVVCSNESLEDVCEVCDAVVPVELPSATVVRASARHKERYFHFCFCLVPEGTLLYRDQLTETKYSGKYQVV